MLEMIEESHCPEMQHDIMVLPLFDPTALLISVVYLSTYYMLYALQWRMAASEIIVRLAAGLSIGSLMSYQMRSRQ